MAFVEAIEEALGHDSGKRVSGSAGRRCPATYADVDDLMQDVGFKPETPIKTGIQRFVDWYREYYGA